LIDSPAAEVPMMDLRLKGSGAAIVGLFDSRGKILLTKRWVVTGSDAVEVRSRLPLSLATKGGRLPVVPILIDQTNDGQAITFDGKKPAEMALTRARAIRISQNSFRKIQAASKLIAARMRAQAFRS